MSAKNFMRTPSCCPKKAHRSGRIRNLVGSRFGRLKVVSIYRRQVYGNILTYFWKCHCDCGGRLTVAGSRLIVGNVKSCGCLILDRIKDLQGRRFGRLTVVRRYGRTRCSGKLFIMWRCVCECGKKITVSGNALKTGNTTSCGCYQRESAAVRIGKVQLVHGMSGTTEHIIWKGMWRRCTNPRELAYKNYGAIGIKVCRRWRKFDKFYSDMGPRPSCLHTLDRFPDPWGDYKKTNCRWATRKQQARNKRHTVFLTYRKKTRPLVEWAEIYNMPPHVIKNRLKKGWSIEAALMSPFV